MVFKWSKKCRVHIELKFMLVYCLLFLYTGLKFIEIEINSVWKLFAFGVHVCRIFFLSILYYWVFAGANCEPDEDEIFPSAGSSLPRTAEDSTPSTSSHPESVQPLDEAMEIGESEELERSDVECENFDQLRSMQSSFTTLEDCAVR